MERIPTVVKHQKYEEKEETVHYGYQRCCA